MDLRLRRVQGEAEDRPRKLREKWIYYNEAFKDKLNMGPRGHREKAKAKFRDHNRVQALHEHKYNNK